jgi:IMP dehydrogenase
MVESVKRSESGFIVDPVTLRPTTRSTRVRADGPLPGLGFPVVDDATDGSVGIVTNRDLRLGADPGRPSRLHDRRRAGHRRARHHARRRPAT